MPRTIFPRRDIFSVSDHGNKENKMIVRTMSLTVIVWCITGSLFAQENTTLSTYYPSPVGEYNTMEITRNLRVVGQTDEQASISSDAGGNLTLNSTRSFYQLEFDPGSGPTRPYSFLQPCTVFSYTCPSGYVANGYLDANKIRVLSIGGLGISGYCICTKGIEQ